MKKWGYVILGIIFSMYFINSFLTETKHPYLWELFDPFPFFEMEGDYRIHRITYINLITYQFRWILLALYICIILPPGILRSIFQGLLIFMMANTIEWFFNYNQSPWAYRVGFLVLLIPGIIIFNVLNGKEK